MSERCPPASGEADTSEISVYQDVIEAGGQTLPGWRAEYRGTEATGISRSGALKQLVIQVAHE